MKFLKDPKIKPIVIALLLVFSLTTGITYSLLNKEEIETDAIKFKKEYEALNGVELDGLDKSYTSMELSENNPMYYATYDEVYEVLDGTGVIYLGYPECPWCRNLVPVMIESAKKVGLGKIYYINMSNERNQLSLKADGTIETKKEGTKEYLTLVDKLKDVLPVYEGLNDESIKRIYVPIIIFVKDGEIIKTHTGTLDSQTDPFTELTEEQEKELKSTLSEYFLEVSDSACDSAC